MIIVSIESQQIAEGEGAAEEYIQAVVQIKLSDSIATIDTVNANNKVLSTDMRSLGWDTLTTVIAEQYKAENR